MKTLKQYIIGKDIKNKLFSWNWATDDPEKFKVYNVLLENFLADEDIRKLNFRPKIVFYWNLYCSSLQEYVLNGKAEKLNNIIKKCPLSKRELKILFDEA